MTPKEALKILAILRASYPSCKAYKDMTEDDAKSMALIWANQFMKIPYAVVAIAVNKWISSNKYAPSISEIKEKIRGLYYEALGEIPYQHGGIYPFNTREIPPQKLEMLKEIVRIVEPMQTQQKIEPTLDELLATYSESLGGGDEAKRLKGS